MRRDRWLLVLLVLLVLPLTSGFLFADDLTGARSFLCTAVEVTQNGAHGECSVGPPWGLNIPQFIEVDLDSARLRTTEASGENRNTPIKNTEREGGLIILQGAERGRAFSFVISEMTGMASIAVAMDGQGVLVSGACTPLTGSD